jgi:hypothetical protein
MSEDIKYNCNKDKVKDQKQILRNEMKHRVKEEEWDKL